MKEVRQLEADIVGYQNELRANIQDKQLREYVEIGDEKMKEFYELWESRFMGFEDDSLRKIEDLKFIHEEQMEMIN